MPRRAAPSSQEAGNASAKACLKLVFLANIMSLSDINPFDSREAKVFKDDPEIDAMVSLRAAWQTCFKMVTTGKCSAVC